MSQQQQLDSDPFSNYVHSCSNNNNETSRNVTFAVQQHQHESPHASTGLDPQSQPLSAPDSPPASVVSVVRPLAETPEVVRWMYKADNEKLWKPFTGYDSIQLENRYQEIKSTLKHPLGIRPAVSAVTAPEAGPVDGSSSGGVSRSTIVSEFLRDPERRFSLVNKSIFSYAEARSTSMGIGTNKWFNPWPGAVAGSGPTSGEGTNVTTDAAAAESQGQELPQSQSHQEPTSTGSGNDTDDWIFNKGLIPQSPPSHIVIVRSGLYEADLSTWRCKSTFWPCDTAIIVRGTWFLEATWEPLPMDYAEQLEQEHLDKFAEAPITIGFTATMAQQSHSLPESPTKGRVPTRAHRASFPEYHIDWASPAEIHLYRKRSSSAFMKSVSQKLGFQWGERVARGYFRAATPGDRPPAVGHVVFVVHGIGQKMDTNRIVRNCSTFRENVDGLQSKYFDIEGGRSTDNKIAIFLPIEWRTSLRLDGDLVESITPNRIVGLRQLLNTTAMDIMYYTSPLYRQEIQSALRNELNRTCRNFLRRRPEFVTEGGKFSILAHSLGSVITYDIITCPLLQNPDEWPEGRIEQRVNAICTTNGESGSDSSSLDFNLEHFFCLGSPLSVFLALRWREPHNPALRRFIIPDALCRRMYNIFDLNDPIAYRLEPILNRAYTSIPPMTIPSHAAPSQAKYEEMVREIVNGGDRLEPPEYVPCVDAGVGQDLLYGFAEGDATATVADGDQQRSPPPPTSAAPADSFFSAIYNYWSQKQAPESYNYSYNRAGFESPNEMEVAAARLDSINFQLGGSFDVDESADDDASCSLSMNVGSELQSCYSSTSSGFTAVGSGSDGGPVSGVQVQARAASPPSLATGARQMLLQPIVHDLDYRLDFVMRESMLPIPTGYLAALTSHTSYWSSPDIGYFVLAHLYNRIPSETRRTSDGASSVSVTSPQ